MGAIRPFTFPMAGISGESYLVIETPVIYSSPLGLGWICHGLLSLGVSRTPAIKKDQRGK